MLELKKKQNISDQKFELISLQLKIIYRKRISPETRTNLIKLVYSWNYYIKFTSIFLPRVAEFIYIEGDNKRVCLLLEL